MARWFLALSAGLVLAMAAGAWAPALRAQAIEVDMSKLKDEQVVRLDELVVSGARDNDENYDTTGMGGPDAELEEAPFADELIAGDARQQEEFDIEITNELQLASGVSPADLATAVNRVNLRGFPTPRLRNGFSQTGIPEIPNVMQTQLIQGPIISVTGRAAPGGIQDFITGRPYGRSRTTFSAMTTSYGTRDVRIEETAPIVPKKYWQRVSAGWRETEGPMSFARTRTRYANAQFTLKHSRAASTMVSFDFLDMSGNPATGVPEYRETTGGKIIGPYLPLATFNSFGPNASVYKRLSALSILHDAQLSRRIALRASLFGYNRYTLDDRFSVGQYIINDDRYGGRYTGKMGGEREPRRIEQPLSAVIASAEVTARLALRRTDHKITLRVEHTRMSYSRIERTLTTADRRAQPADVLTFDPYAPNYYRPAYSDELYSRFITNRDETTAFTSIAASERVAFWRGKLVGTLGARFDVVDVEVADHRPGAAQPLVNDRVTEITWHGGANYVVRPGRLLLFVGTSKAFEPSTRVDERTGRVQGNETTFGYEAGLKGLFLKRRLGATLLLFQYFNQNISRRNLLYNDPIQDADHSQPQLRAAGEERFTGGSLDLKADIAPGFMVIARAAFIEPITTKSPDYPEEIGRVLTRMPETTIGVTARYTFPKKAPSLLANLSTSVTLTHISDFVAYYENASRHYLAYPSNTLVTLSVYRTWTFGNSKRPMRHTLGASVRNLFDRDQLYSLARPGQSRALTLSYRFTW